jgi:hypothetical protein
MYSKFVKKAVEKCLEPSKLWLEKLTIRLKILFSSKLILDPIFCVIFSTDSELFENLFPLKICKSSAEKSVKRINWRKLIFKH